MKLLTNEFPRNTFLTHWMQLGISSDCIQSPRWFQVLLFLQNMAEVAQAPEKHQT